MDETMVMTNGSSEISSDMGEMEIRPASEEPALPADDVQDDDRQSVAESEEHLEVPETSGCLSGSSVSLDSGTVQAVVDAVLESDQVDSLIQTFQDTLESVSAAVASISEKSGEITEPLEVVPVEDVLERMTSQAVESQSVESQTVAPQTVQAASIRSSPVAVAGGEIVVPGAEEIIVAELVQSLLSYFQEDDNGLLTSIRDNTADIKTKVTEIAEHTAVHAMLDTPFEDYSVTEGLLLILVLWLAVIQPCIKMIKGGFSWLAW